MSQRQYAAHRGTSHSTVQRAISSGRITQLPDGRIDSDLADQQWRNNTTPYAPASGRRTDDDEDGSGFSASQYTKARAVREHYQARLSKLEYEEKVGSLVSKAEVTAAAFNKFREFRDHLLNIPDRIAAMLAAETEAAKCYEILAVEIRKSLNDFADANS